MTVKVLDDELEKIYLDESKVYAITDDERLIIRLEALDYEYLLFHEKLVKILLSGGVKGTLFVPLKTIGKGYG